MFFRRRPNLLPLLLLVGGILVSGFVLKKMKDLYDSNQKNHRMQYYKKYMSDVSELFDSVARSDNRSADNLRLLNNALRQSIDNKAVPKDDAG